MEALLIGLVLLIILMMLGVPVAMSFGALAVFMVTWFHQPTMMLVPAAFYQLKSVVLLSVPFFIMLGTMCEVSGLSEKLIAVVDPLLDRIKGGLGTMTACCCAIFGSIGGTCSSSVAAIGTVMIPRMLEDGYPRGYTVALVACSSVLDQLIPPSVAGIIYALVTQQSLLACWLSTVFPGILLMFILCVFNRVMVRNFPLKERPRVSFKAMAKDTVVSFRKGLVSLLLPVVVLGGVYFGIFTPTEAACIGIIYIIVAAAVLKSFNLKDMLIKGFLSAGLTTGLVLIMLFFMMIVSRVLMLEKVPQQLTEAIANMALSKYVLLFLVNIFLLVVGMIMDDTSGTVLAGTLIYPIVLAAGIHPVHFAAIVGVNLGLGNLTPPCAPILYLAGSIGHSTIDEYIKPALILMWGAFVPVLAVVTYWPDFSLWLPRLAGFVK